MRQMFNDPKAIGAVLVMAVWFAWVMAGRAPVTQFIDTWRDLMWGFGLLHGATCYQKVQGGNDSELGEAGGRCGAGGSVCFRRPGARATGRSQTGDRAGRDCPQAGGRDCRR